MRTPLLVHPVLFALILLTVGCGGSPTAPSNTVDFQGVWQGNWQRTSCSETGGAQGQACSQTPSSGSLRLTLTQTGTAVQGSVEVASFFISASGSVNNSGTLSLTGQAQYEATLEAVLRQVRVALPILYDAQRQHDEWRIHADDRGRQPGIRFADLTAHAAERHEGILTRAASCHDVESRWP